MKKILFTATVFLSAYTLVAQDANATANDLKPVAGANNLELNFVPLNGKPIQMTYVRYRRFLTDKTAFRLGVGITYSSTKADSVFDSNITPNTTVSSGYKMTRLGWELRPGFEKHFAGTNRLSPYIGAELALAGQSSKEVTPNLYAGPNDEFTIVTDRNKNKGGFFKIGANVVAGFDCYITKHLYLGTELGFGFEMTNFSDHRVNTDYPSNVVPGTPDPGNPNPVDQGKEFNVGPNFNSAIRLGFIF